MTESDQRLEENHRALDQVEEPRNYGKIPKKFQVCIVKRFARIPTQTRKSEIYQAGALRYLVVDKLID